MGENNTRRGDEEVVVGWASLLLLCSRLSANKWACPKWSWRPRSHAITIYWIPSWHDWCMCLNPRVWKTWSEIRAKRHPAKPAMVSWLLFGYFFSNHDYPCLLIGLLSHSFLAVRAHFGIIWHHQSHHIIIYTSIPHLSRGTVTLDSIIAKSSSVSYRGICTRQDINSLSKT